MPSCAGCTDGIVVGNLRQAGLPRTKAAGFPSGVVDALDQPNSGVENVSFSLRTRTSRSNHVVPFQWMRDHNQICFIDKYTASYT